MRGGKWLRVGQKLWERRIIITGSKKKKMAARPVPASTLAPGAAAATRTPAPFAETKRSNEAARSPPFDILPPGTVAIAVTTWEGKAEHRPNVPHEVKSPAAAAANAAATATTAAGANVVGGSGGGGADLAEIWRMLSEHWSAHPAEEARVPGFMVMYGAQSGHENVTDRALRSFVKVVKGVPTLVIPQTDTARARVFGDPLVGVLKEVLVFTAGEHGASMHAPLRVSSSQTRYVPLPRAGLEAAVDPLKRLQIGQIVNMLPADKLHTCLQWLENTRM